jgi:hypothetical protein
MEPTIKRVWFKPYQYRIEHETQTYHVKVLHITSRHILTINSANIWNIKTGSVQGLQYKTRSSHLIDLSELFQYPNVVIVFKQRPYKILRYRNESDIDDISGAAEINGTPIYSNLASFLHDLRVAK